MKKNIIKTIRFNEEEFDTIKSKMGILEMTSFSHYIRQMSLHQYIMKSDSTELNKVLENYSLLVRELISLKTNVNQIARRLNAIDSPYKEDLKKIQINIDDINSMLEKNLDEIVRKY